MSPWFALTLGLVRWFLGGFADHRARLLIPGLLIARLLLALPHRVGLLLPTLARVVAPFRANVHNGGRPSTPCRANLY